MNSAVILVGNIGSGKTTEARKYVDMGFYSVDQDSIRTMLGSGKYIFDLKLEPIVKEVSSLLIKRLCEAKVNFVVDGALVNQELRKRIIDIVRPFTDYNISAYVLPEIDRTTAIARRMFHDSRGYTAEEWGAVYDKFKAKTEPVNIDEDFDEILYHVAHNCACIWRRRDYEKHD